MERSNIHREMKNPLLNVNEELSVQPSQPMPFFEKIGLFCALIMSATFLIFSSLSFYIDLFIKSDYQFTLIDLSLIIISLTAIYFIYNAFRRRIVTDILIDMAFQNGIYARLRPLIENIAKASVGADIILERLYNIDQKVENILKEQYTSEIKSGDFTQEPVAIGTSIKFTIKSIFLIMVTMAAFMFLLNFNLGGITPYGVLFIFLMWWGFITNEYNMWKENSAWSAAFFPIVVIPITVMLLGNLFNFNVLMAGMYLSIGFYTLAYYFWAVYATTGSLPIIMATKQELSKEESLKNKFFDMQQKGILKEYLEATIKRLELLQKDKGKQELQHAWKK
jgi:hypothetical protein